MRNLNVKFFQRLEALSDLERIIRGRKVNDTVKNNCPSIFLQQFKYSKDICHRLNNILKEGNFANEFLYYALYYVDRFTMQQRISMNLQNSFRLILTGLIIAEKFHSDEHHSLTFFSKHSGIPIIELKECELQFIELTDYNLNMDDYIYYKCELERSRVQTNILIQNNCFLNL